MIQADYIIRHYWNKGAGCNLVSAAETYLVGDESRRFGKTKILNNGDIYVIIIMFWGYLLDIVGY